VRIGSGALEYTGTERRAATFPPPGSFRRANSPDGSSYRNNHRTVGVRLREHHARHASVIPGVMGMDRHTRQVRIGEKLCRSCFLLRRPSAPCRCVVHASKKHMAPTTPEEMPGLLPVPPFPYPAAMHALADKADMARGIRPIWKPKHLTSLRLQGKEHPDADSSAGNHRRRLPVDAGDPPSFGNHQIVRALAVLSHYDRRLRRTDGVAPS
jgi:hypothetical protein